MKRVIIGFLILLSSLCANSDSNKTWNVASIEHRYSIEYDKNTTCLVRKIAIYKAPKWVAKIETRGGTEVYFSSPKSMFEFYHRPGKWYEIGVKSERDFSKIIVTDYETLKPIDAEKAFYIYGSRAISPAGDDLVAIETKVRAEVFSKKYNGKRIMPFEKISDALIRLLNGRI